MELALRWWHTNHNYHQYSTLFLLSTSTYTPAWAQEHALIQQHRSPLNFPYIQQHLHRTAFAFHIKPNKLHFSRTHTAKRLWRRVRRATRSLHRTQTPTERNIQSWTTLYHLASFNRQRFETSKHLRSGATTNWDVYALWRLAQHVEQPERSRCLSELRSILHFNIHTQNTTQATSPLPLTLSPRRHTCNTTNTAMDSAQHSPPGNGTSNKSQTHKTTKLLLSASKTLGLVIDALNFLVLEKPDLRAFCEDWLDCACLSFMVYRNQSILAWVCMS